MEDTTSQQKRKRNASEISQENEGEAVELTRNYEVDHKKVRAAALLVKARLLCRDITGSPDPEFLSKVLAELGHHNLATDLALAHRVSPAYALTQMLYTNQDREEALKYLPLLSSH